jgi:hypothetical protein
MKKSRLREFVNAAAVVLGLFLVSSQATAAVVCVGTGTVASSCSGVEYNGTTYDVSWALPNYPTSPLPIFSGGTASADAQSVSDTINAALNTDGFTNIEYATGVSTTSTTPVCSETVANDTPCYYVPYRINATTVSTWESRYLTTPSAGWVRGANPSYDFAAQNTRPVTVFTPAAVPVPAALPLMLSGIALVGWMGRRRRQVG